MRWMNLETITQNEVSQKEKDKYCVLTHIYGVYTTLLCTEQQRRQRRKE